MKEGNENYEVFLSIPDWSSFSQIVYIQRLYKLGSPFRSEVSDTKVMRIKETIADQKELSIVLQILLISIFGHV